MVKIAVFDFDGTIYKKDSLIAFYKFMIKRQPWRAIFIPFQIVAFLLHKFQAISTTQFKSWFLIYLYGITPENLENLVKRFWSKAQPNDFNERVTNLISEYANFQDITLICVTASPEFMFLPVLKKFKMDELVGTKTSYIRGKYTIQGLNCRGIQKEIRLSHHLNKDYSIALAVSDNEDDLPLLKKAQQGFKVQKTHLIPVHE